jgi:hypothetical protein
MAYPSSFGGYCCRPEVERKLLAFPVLDEAFTRQHAGTQARVVQGQAAKLRVVRLVVQCGALRATWHWD